jgi:hypothetical protein
MHPQHFFYTLYNVILFFLYTFIVFLCLFASKQRLMRNFEIVAKCEFEVAFWISSLKRVNLNLHLNDCFKAVLGSPGLAPAGG